MSKEVVKADIDMKGLSHTTHQTCWCLSMEGWTVQENDGPKADASDLAPSGEI